ncbi:hypothetical protein Ccrd_017065 [Cynara cardunculus var. scolymus]|uniref:DNA2/NAM7 helicase-like C-terminal domain-containing protein n=1 Tax=Cynara cardunculus var. scolymus TaxID=59895 RepID=A0A103Y8S4_CYNCS|nr:hypothetical protein Ccrd_017065 [Cynara cardunculus var. scolymus]
MFFIGVHSGYRLCSYLFLAVVPFWTSFQILNKHKQDLYGKLLKAKDRNTKRDIRKELKMISKEECKRQQLDVTDIKAHTSVAGHTLHELENVQKSSSAEPTLVLIDIAGCDMEEKKDEEESTLNEGEAEIAIAHAKRLIQSGVHASDIGIITPYSAQVKTLRTKEDKLKEVAISTVDGFQGREKEAIIISMVRSNSKKEVGFLSDRRCMNVVMTRARRQCCIIYDTETVSSDKFLKWLIEYFEENGEYLSSSGYGNE